MVWCKYCVRDCQVDRDHASGYICCTECGRVLYQDIFTDEPTFTKGSAGESRLNGVFVRSIQSDFSESFKRTLENGRRQISDLMIKLEIPDESLGVQAASFYRIAVERSFTRGRRTAHVAAACLYIACRANDKPYLLIDFAIWLTVNVYVLGAVYLQLCKLLRLEEHSFVQKLVDPSLFMHRFTSVLMKSDYKNKVWKTALQIVASMKRDWMQTGRKPSGICGAALYISALSHGFSYSKSEIIKIVHICEATLTKRLVEFENTASGSLTIEEFTQNAEEFERENRSTELPDVSGNDSGKMEVLCQHKGKEPHFAHGLCRSCYKDFLELSGGVNGGSEPPAFQVAEMNRLARAASEKEDFPGEGNEDISTMNDAAPELQSSSVYENLDTSCDGTIGKDGDIPSGTDEIDNLSDIDDLEVSCYLNSEEESRFKKIIWEEMNKEYVQEQAAKEAAASAAVKDLGGTTDDVHAARKLAAAAAAAVAKSREKRKQKRALETKNAGPPQTAAEATRQMLTKKGLSSKINYDVLEKLFDENLPSSTKKPRDPSHDGDIASVKRVKREENEAKMKNPNELEGNEGYTEDDVAEEVDADQMLFDQNEYYYDEDNNDFFDDY